ncbi:choline O-acetyltransferase-like isoform X3 [Biomphalaria glabrata]|uniref:Choline O-acetyltransferase n=1 Tax=Biomphalaria glabrata TaxID=6526 RepID=A0A9W2ZLD8_BIOGL|nr:choline O-acetyltransferase-like isoform X3 [Biomphalaria glabrata]
MQCVTLLSVARNELIQVQLLQDEHPLPKLPVPDLHSTMEKYLNFIKTVVAPQDYAKTKYTVDEFIKPDGTGQILQEYLLKRQQCTDNWATEWWLNDMYLNVRLPVLINSNPAAVFPYQSFPTRREQIRYAAKFIRGMLDFKQLIDTRTLPIDRCKYKEKGQPLCMDQHYRLFSSYREPGRERDVQRTDLGFMGRDFIVVACNNQFYKVDLYNNGEELSESNLCLQLAQVLNMAEQKCNQSEPVGVLTSLPRTLWAEARERLLQDAINRANLHVLENCLFLLCLDKATVPTGPCSLGDMFDDMTARTHHIIHGQGVHSNSANRWMDKTIQLIVSEDGTCGINMEHSVAEGIALTHMIEHAFNFIGKEKITLETTEVNKLPQPKCLLWNLTPQSLEDIQLAKESVDSMVEDFDLTVFKFNSYGREFVKSQNMSPDAYIQLALQLTYYKIHGSLTSTYESASVRRYRQGRVDVIRANSPAALAWVKAMLGQTEATEEEKLHLLTEAIQWQQDYMLQTILGHGIDLHLLGLREAANELGIPTPEVFKDPSYKELNTFRVSTSQVPTVSDYWMGYGAVVPDGYGCCYNPKPDHIYFSVATFNSCIDTSSEMFAHSLESSLLQMAELCRYEPEQLSRR